MRFSEKLGLTSFFAISLFLASPLIAQTPQILDISPAINQLGVPADADIIVTFDVDMDPASFAAATIRVNGLSSGRHLGQISYDQPSRTVTINTASDFFVGELVTVVLTNGIQSSTGSNIDSYSWSFTTMVNPDSPGNFQADTSYYIGGPTRSIASADFDNDGDIDLVCANATSLLSFLFNDGSGKFPILETYAADNRAIMVRAADFNHDDHMDIATANN